MSTPTDDEGGRALFRGRILGFPVHVDLSFVLIMALFGYVAEGPSRNILLWLVIAPLAVLAHELGHAVAARTAGASPRIALVGFGGVTTFTPPRPLSRARSLVISLAGPGVGLALGGLVWLLSRGLQGTLEPFSWQTEALKIAWFTCVAWSVLNLLPVLPLDGGQAMRELLPGSEQVRGRRAAGVSVAVAALAAVGALMIGQQFLAMFMLFFGVTNLLALRNAPAERATRPHDPAAGPSAPGGVGPEQAVVGLLWRSDPSGARRMLESLPAGTQVDLAVHGAVLALTGEPAQGHALLAQEVGRRPGDANAAALLLLTHLLEHDWDAVLAVLQGPLGPAVPPPVVERAVQEARFTGREDVAGRITVVSAAVTGRPPASSPPPAGPAPG